jgi:hypothetical protein
MMHTHAHPQLSPSGLSPVTPVTDWQPDWLRDKQEPTESQPPEQVAEPESELIIPEPLVVLSPVPAAEPVTRQRYDDPDRPRFNRLDMPKYPPWIHGGQPCLN